jgi:hypothetical protein
MATFPPKLVPMMRRAVTLLVLVCALSMGAPIVAAAASGGTASQAISDCNDHGRLTAYYSPSTLKQALTQMPVDVKEYTDCYDVIESQLLKELGHSTSPGTTTAPSTSSSSSFLPTWLIIVIVLLVLAAVTFGAIAIRRRSGGPGDPGAGGGSGGPGAPPPAT